MAPCAPSENGEETLTCLGSDCCGAQGKLGDDVNPIGGLGRASVNAQVATKTQEQPSSITRQDRFGEFHMECDPERDLQLSVAVSPVKDVYVAAENTSWPLTTVRFRGRPWQWPTRLRHFLLRTAKRFSVGSKHITSHCESRPVQTRASAGCYCSFIRSTTQATPDVPSRSQQERGPTGRGQRKHHGSQSSFLPNWD
jgi:hypothetical protein